MASRHTSPGAIRVAVVNDYEIVVAGLAAVLEPFRERVDVVEIDAGLPVVSDVDIVLYDTFGQVDAHTVVLEDLVRDSGARVVVFSWNTQPDVVASTLQRGAHGYLSKQLCSEEIVAALERVRLGDQVGPDGAAVPPVTVADAPASGVAAWPGQVEGLTARESEIIALISQGLANREIAACSYLSINSVKTYIRSAYRKMGVVSRSQAVIWALQHGFEASRSRVVPGAQGAPRPPQ